VIEQKHDFLYKAAQQSEVKMLAERRLRVKLDDTLQDWVKECDGRQKVIESRDAEIADLKYKLTVALDSEDRACAELIEAEGKNQALKTGNAQLREQNKSLADAYKESLLAIDSNKADYATVAAELAKLTADYDATLAHKWEWMQRAQGAEARVGEQRTAIEGLENSVETWQDRSAITEAALTQAQSLLKRTKRMVSEATAESRAYQTRLAEQTGFTLDAKRTVKERDATIKEMAEERDHAWITAENAQDTLKRRITVLESQARSAEDRHVTELGQLQALMDSRVADREETARRLVSAALILLICLTAAFAAFVGLR
jgi:chromosome segregation ATPase